MLFYTLVIFASFASFVSALAVLSSLIVSGREEPIAHELPEMSDLFASLQSLKSVNDESALKRLVDINL